MGAGPGGGRRAARLRGVLHQPRHEVGRPPLQQVRAEDRMRLLGDRAVVLVRRFDAAQQQRRVARLAQHNARARQALAQRLPNAQQCAAGAVRRHEAVELPPLEGAHDLGTRRLAVDPRVRLALELIRPVPPVLLAQRHQHLHHAAKLVRGVGEDDLGAQEAHHLSPLDGEGLGHDAHERVALGCADHREAEAGVARGGLDDRLPRLQQPVMLGVLDHAQRQPILDGAHRIVGLALHVHLHALRSQP